MKSFYDLTIKEAKNFEKEFQNLPLGAYAHMIWVGNNIIGIIFSSVSVIILIMLAFGDTQINLISCFFFFTLLFGLFIVYSATLEYHKKLNSWLRVSRKIVRD